ncbi:MAG TPA: sugar ABC transporter permease [Acidimicrobiales bacterium]|nr:sugar ABC transporter permease [Acidimicrobiales bacterium]
MAKARQLIAYLGPSIVLSLALVVFPLGFIVVMGFTEWAGLGPAKYIGLQNYVFLYHDPSFRSAVVNTLLWGAAGIFVQTPLCLLTALILSRRPKMWKLIRTLLFVPSVVSTTILALMWYFMLSPEIGLVNGTLTDVGLKSLTRSWLSGPDSAQWAIMVPFVLYIGFGMVLFLTQISTVPKETLEAAQLDGANVWQQDLHVTLPAIRRSIALWALFLVGYVLRMFEYPYIMTDGGPVNKTMNLSLYVYDQMVTANQYGLAMAAGVVTVVLGALMMSCVLVVLRWIEVS